MDVSKILAELTAECEQIEEAIRSMEKLARGRRPPESDDLGPGYPSPGDPGPQSPPAAPAAARIAGRLDRGVTGKKLARAI
jgi:hypothetical protein